MFLIYYYLNKILQKKDKQIKVIFQNLKLIYKKKFKVERI